MGNSTAIYVSREFMKVRNICVQGIYESKKDAHVQLCYADLIPFIWVTTHPWHSIIIFLDIWCGVGNFGLKNTVKLLLYSLCSRYLPCACVQCFSFLSLDWLNVLVTCTIWMISCELNKDRCSSWSLSQTSLNVLCNLLTDRTEVISYCCLVSYLLFSSNLLEPGPSLTFWWPSAEFKMRPYV